MIQRQFMRTPMDMERRKVLIIEDEAALRKALFTMVARLECETEAVGSGAEALAKVHRDQFDAVLLDLRCADLDAEMVIPQIHNLRPNLVGRVLVITGDVADEHVLKLIEKYFLLKVPRSRLSEDLQGYLRALLHLRPA
jgi:CheY-like chemotaxis protein